MQRRIPGTKPELVYFMHHKYNGVTEREMMKDEVLSTILSQKHG